MKLRTKSTLTEACESVKYGYTASATQEKIGPYFLRITDIVPDSIDWETVPFCKIDEHEKDRYAVYPGDIVIARTGATVGYAKLIRVSVDCVFASYLVRFRVDPKVADPGFVGRLVESSLYKDYVKSRVGGAAQPNANAKVLGAFEFYLPPLTTQKHVANTLSQYDDLIENNRRRIALLEDSARMLYREWFVHLRFPGHEHTRIISGVPEGWERKTLGDLASITMGQSPESQYYNEEGEGLPFHQGVADFGERYVTHRIYCTAPNRIAEPGDILCSVRAPVGRLNVTLDRIIIGRGLAALQSKTSNQSFLYHQLRTHFFKEDLIGAGAIFASVTKKEFEAQRMLTPSRRLVRTFEEFSCPIDEQLRILFLQNSILRTARDLLLPKLMSGEIAV